MYKVLTLDKIDPQGLGHFPHEKYETGNSFTSPDAIILRSFNMHSMELPESVKAVARAGAGVNNIPIDRCTEQGIVVFNTPGANANGVKELVLAGLLLASRDISGGIAWAKGLVEEGDQVPALVEKGKKNYAGTEILGKSLAVIGLGAVGVLVANAAQMLGMNVTGYDPYISVAQAQKLSDKIQLARTLESAIASADFVTLNIPLTPDTKGYISKEIIKGMKNGVRVLNFARGELVNNADMAGPRIRKGVPLCHRLPQRGNPEDEKRHLHSPSGCLHRRVGDQLRHHGGRPAEGVLRTGQHHQLGEFPECRDGSHRGHPYRGRQPEYPQHGQPDRLCPFT